ncbi:hypothetical protein CBL_00571 [Carabus blaptoides fortunei]
MPVYSSYSHGAVVGRLSASVQNPHPYISRSSLPADLSISEKQGDILTLCYYGVRTEPRLSLLSVERQPAAAWQPCAAPLISTVLDKYSRLPPPPSSLLLPPTAPTPATARLPCVHPRVC